ncbi:hypothetical protein F5Y17DRAFT_8070 [Xylariaceae sp. FL0594]|nr:hypothetical protein F5Y17DRAFT_8070 [Xylariaceae sp. FL0594]
MESSEIPDRYYTYDGRLASFQTVKPAARRGSNAKGRAQKGPSWPSAQLNPETFARAGFFYQPQEGNLDNTVCFLCCKNISGWDEDDNPFEEHLRLSPHCGWAIVAGIETGLGDYALDDPTSSEMIAARKATFADRWPHEGKRGWKCKTKQLVDAGWKYTPTMESNDMATCTYCQLALDGWEPKDNPMDEHYRRSPNCPFFILINQYKAAAPAKKKAKGKSTRVSKASRVSIQSVATTMTDATLLADHAADYDDSIVTTTSVMTQGGTKRGKAKKATGAKGKKSRAKKGEAVELREDPVEATEPEQQAPPPQADEDTQEAEEAPRKPARGRKRNSAVLDESGPPAEAPAPKKRATRRTASIAAEQQQADRAMFEPSPPEIDDAAIDAELKALEAEMKVEPAETLHVPKKGRQAGTRKVSKQATKKTKAKTAVETVSEPEPKQEPEPEPEPEPALDPAADELAEGHDSSMMSSGTAGRPSLASIAIGPVGPKKRGRPSKKAVAPSSPVPKTEGDDELESTDAVEPEPAPAVPEKDVPPKLAKNPPPSRDKSLPPPPPQELDDTPPPSTPKTSPSAAAPAASQATIAAMSPSKSPQSSDAENRAPSSKPSNTDKSTRVALAPVEATTPVRTSPSKRNIIAGLQSTHPWTAADVEAILDELDKENALVASRLPGGGDLTSPEKQMTVEEWVYYNAEQAEKRLKCECESIVMRFEQEGTRAMQALEGIIVE